MKHIHTFGCPVFALHNMLAKGKKTPRWSPRARLGLNLGTFPMHARNVYLVLNLSTGCVSPQYHCRFDDFFETTRHGAPDVLDTITWQMLAGLGCTSEILSQVSAPTLRSTNYGLSQSDSDVPLEDSSIISAETDVDWDTLSISDGDSFGEIGESGVMENEDATHAEGGTTTATPISAGTSLRGRARTMS